MTGCAHENLYGSTTFIQHRPRSLDEVVKTTDVTCQDCRTWQFTISVRLDGTAFTEREGPYLFRRLRDSRHKAEVKQ